MTGEIEAVGDIMTGSVLASVIEPEGGAESHSHGEHCLNCKVSLVGSHCYACGQKAKVHRTLGAFFHDFMHSILHFEGKIWRTLPLLFLKPGELTLRYVHGERARFVSPLALFLFSIFLMFAGFNLLGGPVQPTVHRNGVSLTHDQVGAVLTKQKAALARLEKELANGSEDYALEGKIAGIKGDIEGLEKAYDFSGGFDPSDITVKQSEIKTGSKWLDDHIAVAVKNPSLYFYKMQSSAYKFSWILIPLSVPFLWFMFFWRREFKVYDHAVFITYSLCFVGFALILTAIARKFVGADLATGILSIAIVAHFYVQLKGAYGLSRGQAIWRTFGLIVSALIVLTVFALLMALQGVV